MSCKVWVLVDNRIGGANQAIELADALGEEFEIKHIEYNYFAKLPNRLLSLFPVHVKKSILKDLKDSPIPEIIISAGRRTAALALHLKKISKHPVKIIQIMRPNLDPKEFELIILPQHDNFNYTLPNVVRVLGALNDVKKKIANKINDFEAKYPDLKQFIAVIVGGSTKNYTLNLENGKILADTISHIADSHSLPLFISFSRRTPANVKAYFRENFAWPNIIYDPLKDQGNPYPAMLSNAEYIISTTDSISMCSESASTGKPVYIFCPPNFKSKKHHFFIQQLVDLGVIRRLHPGTNYLEKYQYEPLSEIRKVVNIIKKRMIKKSK